MFQNGSKELNTRLQLLHKITQASGEPLPVQLQYALKEVTELLDMEIGIISEIEGSDYIIRYFYPEESGLQQGQIFNLSNTYCSITLNQGKAFSVIDMGQSPYSNHPCYEVFSLESYIGIPVQVEGELYGTINFSSSKTKSKEFLPSDFSLIQLLAAWVGNVIKRINIEKELAEKNLQYELISSGSADMACLHDLEGNYQFVSDSVKRILGYDAEELIGRNHYEFVHPDDIQKLQRDPHSKVREGEMVESTQYRIRRKDGEYIWVESSVSPILNEQGEPVKLQSVTRDITDRKRLEVLFSETQKMAQVGGWEFDLKTGQLYWTDEVYRIHDMEIGTEVFVEEGLSFFPVETRDKIEKAINHTVETGEGYDLRLEFISKKGNHKWVRAIGHAIMLEGKAIKLTGTFQDISNQVKAEQMIIKQNEQLAKNDEARKKLYSIIGHDLRGAFFGIIGLLEILEEDLQEEEVAESHINNIRLLNNSARNAHQLMENLVKWIKVQDSFEIRDLAELDIHSIIEESISLLKPSLFKKKITVKNNTEDITINGDKDMLSTVFRNLISNAIKFSQPGSEILVQSSRPDEDFIQISVRDFGVGMSEEVLKNLFNTAFRPKMAGTQKEMGTGLGLILCNELVEMHKGSIMVKSVEGQGSEFIVTLPAAG